MQSRTSAETKSCSFCKTAQSSFAEHDCCSPNKDFYRHIFFPHFPQGLYSFSFSSIQPCQSWLIMRIHLRHGPLLRKLHSSECSLRKKQMACRPIQALSLLFGMLSIQSWRPSSPILKPRASSSASPVGKEYVYFLFPPHILLKSVLFKEYKIICTLCSQSGFGWDDLHQMVTATPDVWERYIAIYLLPPFLFNGLLILCNF